MAADMHIPCLGHIDTTATTSVTVERRPSGSWLTRWKSSRDKSDKETEFVEVTKAEAPVPPPKDHHHRPNPVKTLSETALHVASSAFRSRHPPQRANTMGPAVTTSMAVVPAQLPPLPVATQPAAPDNQGTWMRCSFAQGPVR